MLIYRPWILLTEFSVIKTPAGYADIVLPPAALLHLKCSPVHKQEKLLRSRQHHMLQTHVSLQMCSLQYQQLYGKNHPENKKEHFITRLNKKPLLTIKQFFIEELKLITNILSKSIRLSRCRNKDNIQRQMSLWTMVLHAKMSIFTSTKTQQRVWRRWNPSVKWTEEKKNFNMGSVQRKRSERRERRKGHIQAFNRQ